MRRREHRADENQEAIVSALRQYGCSVVLLSQVGGGCPDVLACHGGTYFMFEIKNPAKPKRDRMLTPDQVKFHESWHGRIDIVETVEQAINIVMREMQARRTEPAK